MENLCSGCKKEIKPGKNFCGFCGRPVQVKVRQCSNCNEELEDMEQFCPNCGVKYLETTNIETPQPAFMEYDESLNKGTLLYIYDSKELRFLRGTGDDEKKAVRKLRKEANRLFLYSKDERVAFIRKENSSYIEGYSYDNIHAPFIKYTVSNEVDHVWRKSTYAKDHYYFFHNLDAFFAWDGYIFLSVYKGKIVWSASDGRDTWLLPNQKSDEIMHYPGTPQLEFLPNGYIRSAHFYGNTKCKLVNGVFIPIKEK